MHCLCTTPIQALDTGEGGHSIEYATTCERKPLNRFKNIVVCKLLPLVVQIQFVSLCMHLMCACTKLMLINFRPDSIRFLRHAYKILHTVVLELIFPTCYEVNKQSHACIL